MKELFDGMKNFFFGKEKMERPERITYTEKRVKDKRTRRERKRHKQQMRKMQGLF